VQASDEAQSGQGLWVEVGKDMDMGAEGFYLIAEARKLGKGFWVFPSFRGSVIIFNFGHGLHGGHRLEGGSFPV
jgi:hypothetical protein